LGCQGLRPFFVKKKSTYPAAPHLRRHRPAHVRKAHIAGRFLASAALLDSYEKNSHGDCKKKNILIEEIEI
jgi:hypothetical protein